MINDRDEWVGLSLQTLKHLLAPTDGWTVHSGSRSEATPAVLLEVLD